MRGEDLNLQPPDYEPDELPIALPRDIVEVTAPTTAPLLYNNSFCLSSTFFDFFKNFFSRRAAHATRCIFLYPQRAEHMLR